MRGGRRRRQHEGRLGGQRRGGGAVQPAGVRQQLLAARHQPHLRLRGRVAAPRALEPLLPGLAGAAAAGVRRARRLLPHLPARHQAGRGGRAQPHLPGHHHLQPQRVPLLQDHPQRHVPRGRAAGAAQRPLRDQQPAAGRARRPGRPARQGQLQELQGEALQHGRVLQPHGPRPGRHAAAVLLPRRQLHRPQLHRDLHPPGQVLHLQLGGAGHGAADHAAGRRGQRPGADAQHPAGRIPARVGRHGRDLLRGGREGADPQPGGAALHRPAGLRRGARLPDLRVLPAAAAGVPPAALGGLQGHPHRVGLLHQLQHHRLPPRLRDPLPGRELQLPHGAHARQRQRLHPGAVQGVCRPGAGLPGEEGQRVLRLPHALRHGALRQRALHGEDPQQGLRQVPGQEVQQDGAVHRGERAGPGHLLRGPELRDDRAEEGVRGGGAAGRHRRADGALHRRQPPHHPGDLRLPVRGVSGQTPQPLQGQEKDPAQRQQHPGASGRPGQPCRRVPAGAQSACHPLRGHSDSLGFAPNMLPRHPALGTFEEFAC